MFYKEINGIKIKIIVIFFLLTALLVSFIPLKSFTVELMKTMYSETKELPDIIKNMIGNEGNLEKFEDNDYYLLSQWQGKNLGQFIPLVILLIAFPLLSKEYDKKTIYFLLSRINRKKLFSYKYFTGLLVSVCTISVLVFLGPIFMNLFGYKTGFYETFLVYIQELFSILFLYNLFFLFSAIFREQIKTFIIGIIACFIFPFFSMYKPIAFLNIYTYIFGQNILNGDGIDWLYSIMLLIISIFLFFVSRFHFLRKDI